MDTLCDWINLSTNGEISFEIARAYSSILFSNDINHFYAIERKNSVNLIDLNKKFIVFILNFIKKKISQQSPNKITIMEDRYNK